ncbi:MAG: mevalonate kinase [Deltaproteobacteria bacterium]|nr:mevalonate kinase [Deltaproteobacteria bacterium]
MSGVGHGKAILLGEHAVVEGAPALVSALPEGVIVEAGPGAPRLEIEVPGWSMHVRNGDPGLPGEALAALCAALVEDGLPPEALEVKLSVEARIPDRAGVGSSAALAVGLARALAERAEYAPLLEEGADARLEAIVAASEAVFHGRASGVDAAVAVHGGVGLFQPGRGFSPLTPGVPASLVVAHTGPKPPTREAVEHVRQRCRASAEARRALQRLGDLAEAGEELLRAGDLRALGEAMDEAQHHLAFFDLSTPDLDAAVAAARAAGALGAKLTGAGGGGCIVALCPVGEERPVAESLERRCPWVGSFPCEEKR